MNEEICFVGHVSGWDFDNTTFYVDVNFDNAVLLTILDHPTTTAEAQQELYTPIRHDDGEGGSEFSESKVVNENQDINILDSLPQEYSHNFDQEISVNSNFVETLSCEELMPPEPDAHPLAEVEMFHCGTCDLDFSNKDFYNIHCEDDIHTSKVYICSLCGKGYTHPYSLRDHIRDKNSTTPKSGCLCDICSKTFWKKKHLLEHIRDVHNAPRKINKRKGTIQCEKCNQYYSTAATLRAHNRRKHEARAKVQCDICSLWYVDENGLKNHMKTKHGISKEECCKECGMLFSTRDQLRNHRRYKKCTVGQEPTAEF